MKKFILSIIASTAALAAFAQCNPGEVEVTVVAYSYDPWGEETYWELVPSGNGCGNGTLIFGSNLEVGCGVGGPTGENGIPDYGSQSASICLPEGDYFDLYFYDSFGDGGLAFDVYQDGVLTNMYVGGGWGNVWTFQAGFNPNAVYDSPCGALEIVPDITTATLNLEGCIVGWVEPNPPGLSCEAFGAWCNEGNYRSAWAYFIAEEGKSYEITSCHPQTNFDNKISVWHATDCGNLQTFQLVSSNDNTWGGCDSGNPYAATCYASCLEPGGIYYICLDGTNWWDVGSAVVSVTSYQGPVQLSAQVNDITCPLVEGQTPNGSIFPSIVGASSDFSCVWTGSNGYFSLDHFALNLQPGNYFLSATTTCGTVFEGTYTIGLPTPWDVSIDVTPATCPLSENGVISVNVVGGTPGYTYNYDGPGTFGGEGQTLSNAILGSYIVNIYDSQGCLYQEEVYVDAADEFSIEIGPDTTLCLGDTLVVEGPPGVNYLWNDGSIDQNLSVYSEEYGEGISAIFLTASTDDGCSDTDVLIMTVEVCVGVDEVTSAETELTVYPNPCQDVVTVQSELLQGGEVFQLIDLTGRKIHEGRLNKNAVIELGGLPSGAYLIRVLAENVVLKSQPVLKAN